MSQERIGVWFIGAWGGVATTATVGIAALQGGLSEETALVSSRPQFQDLNLIDWKQLVIGGHEIRQTTYTAEADVLYRNSRVFSPELLSGVAARLKEFDANIRPGTLINSGPTIAKFAEGDILKYGAETPKEAIARLRQDLADFKKKNGLSRVIVVNVSSTEPPLDTESPTTWGELENSLETSKASPVPASSLYAIAALQEGCPHVNFTPSVGTNIPALYELAEKLGVLHVGRDGKTGETLMKSILAPMFADRNLKVMSWVGHNIFGNMDGKVLDDPINKANKVRSKDHLLTEILGYKPQTLVSIEYIESMGDWKTAWDHIHFEGFLGTKMALQFTWQGCDSLLAAPLVLDLIRFTEREQRRGAKGVMSFLSSFFKSPMGCDYPEFHNQYRLLEQWAAEVRGK